MNKRIIGVYLDSEERAALSQLAERERRKMREQAAVIIRRELERAGLLTDEVQQVQAHRRDVQIVHA